MTNPFNPARTVILDLDGLRRDVYLAAAVVADRCANGGQREPSIADMAPVLRAMWDA